MKKENGEERSNAQYDFLRMIRDKGPITIEDAFAFENKEEGVAFGPGIDVLMVIRKFKTLGIIRFNKKGKIKWIGFNKGPEAITV